METDETNPSDSPNPRRRKRTTTDTFRKLISDEPLRNTDTIFENATEETVGPGADTIFDEKEPQPESPFAEDKDGRRPDRRAVRVSGEDFLSTGVMAIGTVLVSKRIDPPVGRVLQLGGPLYGTKIDQVIAGTFLDRILQPLFRKGDQLNDLGALIAVPACVAILERRPETAPLMMGILTESLGTMLEDLAPKMAKTRAKRRRAARSLTDVNDAFDIPKGVDPVEHIIREFIFGDFQPPQEGEMNGQAEG